MTMNTMTEIAQLIRQTRKALGLRQDELASVAGIGVRTLSEIENGKETAQTGLVLRVLDCLGIDIQLTPTQFTPRVTQQAQSPQEKES